MKDVPKIDLLWDFINSQGNGDSGEESKMGEKSEEEDGKKKKKKRKKVVEEEMEEQPPKKKKKKKKESSINGEGDEVMKKVWFLR